MVAHRPLHHRPGAEAVSHSWYPFQCCSDRDCYPLEEEDGKTATQTADGWRLWDGRIVARGITKLSPDGQFHICESPAKAIFCFVAPPGTS